MQSIEHGLTNDRAKAQALEEYIVTTENSRIECDLLGQREIPQEA